MLTNLASVALLRRFPPRSSRSRRHARFDSSLLILGDDVRPIGRFVRDTILTASAG